MHRHMLDLEGLRRKNYGLFLASLWVPWLFHFENYSGSLSAVDIKIDW